MKIFLARPAGRRPPRMPPLSYAEIWCVFMGQDFLRTCTPYLLTLNPVLSENSVNLIRNDPYSSRIAVYLLFEMVIPKSVLPRRVESWLLHPGCNLAADLSDKGFISTVALPNIRNLTSPGNGVSGYVRYLVKLPSP